MFERVTSRQNREILRIKKLGASAAFRREEGEFVCEGGKLLEEALGHGADIRTVVIREDSPLPPLPQGVRVISVPGELLEYASTQKTPNALLFTCRIPAAGRAYGEGAHIVLENVQDPGNLGTIMRTASAFGLRRVVLLGDCADPYGAKAVRASMGAVFRVTIANASYDETDTFTREHPLYAAALGDGCADVRDVPLRGCSVAIGSEGQGLSERLLKLCTGRVRIPMTADCESLNAAAAAAVLLWELCGKDLPRE